MTAVDGSTARARPARAGRAAPGALILALGLLLAVLLVLPGRTVVTNSLDQLFVAFDGIHRVLSGQVPNRDFHGAAGPLAFLVPALGYVLSGGYGGALPAALALTLLVVTLPAAHVLSSRLRPSLSLLLAAVLLLTLAAPLHPGQPVTALSYVTSPNRVGFASVALLLVMVLDPHRGGRRSVALDAVVAAALTLLAFYTQATFALVAGAFLLLVLLAGPRRLWAGLALGLAGLVAGGVELAWGGTRQYLTDLLIAYEAGGWWRGGPRQVMDHVLVDPSACLLVALLAAVALWRSWSPRLLLFILFCAVARAWLVNLNDPRWSTLPLYAAAAVLAEHLLRAMDRERGPSTAALVNPAGVHLYVAALLLPTVVRCSTGLLLHLGTALAAGGTPLPLAGMDGVRLANLWSDREFEASSGYLATVADGVAALSGLDAPRVLALGTPNPFPAVLGLPPPRGDMIDMRWDAALEARHGAAPEDLLADVDVVVERLWDGGSGRLGDLFRPALEKGFAQVAETAHWRVFRRTAARGAGSDGAGATPPEGVDG